HNVKNLLSYSKEGFYIFSNKNPIYAFFLPRPELVDYERDSRLRQMLLHHPFSFFLLVPHFLIYPLLLLHLFFLINLPYSLSHLHLSFPFHVMFLSFVFYHFYYSFSSLI